MKDQIEIDVIESRIRNINDSIDEIEKILEKEFAEQTQTSLYALRYLLIQLVESSAGICIHLMKKCFREKPTGYPDCFVRLSKKGIFPEDLGQKLASAGRLRNVLVHRYWTIDDTLVYNSTKDGISDFRAYIEHIIEFIWVE